MIDTSPAYKAAIIADKRHILAKAVIDIIDPDITYGAVTASGQSAQSNGAQLYDKNFDVAPRYASLEQDRWTLGGGYNIFPTDAATIQTNFIGNVLSGSDGSFATAQWVQMNFSNVSILQACSIWFSQDPADGVAEDFKIEVFCGNTAYFSQTVTGNKSSNVGFERFTVYDPTAIKVTVTKWSLPSRFVRLVEIVPGIYEQWRADDCSTLEVRQEINPSCLSLPYGTATIRMDNLSRRFEPRSKNGVFQSVEERQGIPLFFGVVLPDKSTEWVPCGVYYQTSGGWTTGDNGLVMQWDLVDIIGLIADRAYIAPATLPTTLSGWVASIVAQLGSNFTALYTVDAAYASLPLSATAAEIQGKTCGEILRYACMATATFPRADAETGKLAVEPLWSAGSYVTLDNLNAYPVMSANDDLAAVIFKLYDGSGNDTTVTIGGNNTASSQTISVDNPFLKTSQAAQTAARNILACYGGNKLEVSSRGDMASELGDVDSIQLDRSSATSARRITQQLGFNGNVMTNLPATFLQADGSFLYQSRAIITASGTWTSPTGVTSLRIIVVGGGDNGANGTNGTWGDDGQAGADGLGGKVYAFTINCNSGQSFNVTIGGAGADTVFGAYSSASGQRFNGYTDIANGSVFARDGVAVPLPNSGDGGKGGTAGRKGITHEVSLSTVDANGNVVDSGNTYTVIDSHPTPGGAGAAGASGCVVVYYDKAVSQ